MSSSTKITLTSKDDETFEIDEAAALQSVTIKFLIEDGVADNPIPVPNVTGKILAKVIEYCKKHADAASSDDKEKPSEDELKNWDTEFVNVDRGMLFELVLAANYLNIKDLLELTCATIANIIKGKTSEEIRQTFNIVNDFSPEEEEEIRKENEWAFE